MHNIGSSTHTLSISLSTMIVNGTKEHLPSLLEHRHGAKNLRREPKLAWELVKIPYYIVAYLFRSPDFVTLAALRPVLNKLHYNKVVGFRKSGHMLYSHL